MHSLWPDYFDTLAQLGKHANVYGSAPPPLAVSPPLVGAVLHIVERGVSEFGGDPAPPYATPQSEKQGVQ